MKVSEQDESKEEDIKVRGLSFLKKELKLFEVKSHLEEVR